ncbi:cytochrome bd oxidase small subunit CydS [Paenibacillus vini]
MEHFTMMIAPGLVIVMALVSLFIYAGVYKDPVD